MSRAVLLVEDDAAVRHVVRLVLKSEGFTVVESADAASALEQFQKNHIDTVLLDLTLPDDDGLEVCRKIRAQSAVPIIMVTARRDSHDVVAGLEAGADDYVTKPFVAKELTARIRALLRRLRRVGTPQTVTVGTVEICPHEGYATRDGELLSLTRTEFSLLCELATEPRRVFSREELLERVWGYDYFGDIRLVDVHIRRLRTKVEQVPAEPAVIVTVRGVGYRLGTITSAGSDTR